MSILGESISPVNLVDVIAFVVIAFSIVLGAKRGLSSELAGTVSMVVGFILGMVLFAPMVAWLVDHSRLEEQSARIVSFILVFLVVFAIMLVIRVLLRLLLKIAIDKKADRWGGAMAGFLKSLVVVLAVFLALIMSPSEKISSMFGEDSMIGSLLIKMVPELKQGMGDKIGEDSEVIQLLDGERD